MCQATLIGWLAKPEEERSRGDMTQMAHLLAGCPFFDQVFFCLFGLSDLGHSRSKVDGFVPRNERVDLGIELRSETEEGRSKGGHDPDGGAPHPRGVSFLRPGEPHSLS